MERPRCGQGWFYPQAESRVQACRGEAPRARRRVSSRRTLRRSRRAAGTRVRACESAWRAARHDRRLVRRSGERRLGALDVGMSTLPAAPPGRPAGGRGESALREQAHVQVPAIRPGTGRSQGYRGDEPKSAGAVREDPYGPRPALDLPVEALQAVRGPETRPVALGERVELAGVLEARHQALHRLGYELAPPAPELLELPGVAGKPSCESRWARRFDHSGSVCGRFSSGRACRPYQFRPVGCPSCTVLASESIALRRRRTVGPSSVARVGRTAEFAMRDSLGKAGWLDDEDGARGAAVTPQAVPLSPGRHVGRGGQSQTNCPENCPTWPAGPSCPETARAGTLPGSGPCVLEMTGLEPVTYTLRTYRSPS